MTISNQHYNPINNKRIQRNPLQSVFFVNCIDDVIAVSMDKPLPNTVKAEAIDIFSDRITKKDVAPVENAHHQVTKQWVDNAVNAMSLFALTDDSIDFDSGAIKLNPVPVELMKPTPAVIADKLTDLGNDEVKKLAKLLNRLADARELQNERGFSDMQKAGTVEHLQHHIESLLK